MEQENHSDKIRNYAIASLCIVLTIMAVILFLLIFMSMGGTPANIWSQCNNVSANIFINANKDLKEVRCTALDKELFDKSEISLGDMSKNDEDVCRFKLSGNATEPLRFEVRYNNEVRREVCTSQQFIASND